MICREIGNASDDATSNSTASLQWIHNVAAVSSHSIPNSSNSNGPLRQALSRSQGRFEQWRGGLVEGSEPDDQVPPLRRNAIRSEHPNLEANTHR